MFPPRKKSTKHVSSIENVSTREDHQKDLFEVHFLGIVPDIVISGSHTRDREAQLVDRIEEAQIEGRLPMVAQDDEKVKLNISIHGFIVLGMKGQEQASEICQNVRAMFDKVTEKNR
ncbi:hypothetical protein MAR_037218 [Mya arenaria]|uniref:Uncharacterized protein n=1 Tax=Mya arenaria TaxID=6604 RepID=A0ABY7FQF3_MYAAR|nr:hypothetical protein MAR_037218 [Mya arenaria]